MLSTHILAVVHDDPSPIVGALVGRDASVVQIDASALAGALDAASPQTLVVVGPGDPERTSESAGIAIERGARVVLEAPGVLGSGALRQLDRAAARSGARAFAGLRYRYEPGVAALAGAVADGRIGLPLSAVCEALGVPALDPLTVAIDLLDALEAATALRVTAIARVAAEADLLTLAVSLENDVTAVVGATTYADASSAQGNIWLSGSHGEVVADLECPIILRRDGGPSRRWGPTGTQRLFEAIGGGAEPASLARAALLIDLIEG